MLRSFLEEVIEEVLKKQHPVSDIVFVLPSKRAGTFLRNALANTLHATIFAPEIFSIEEFIEKISLLSYASNTEQLFELYRAYDENTTTKKDDFFAFSKWGQTLLQDFNEIDRYLIHAKKLYANLSSIQELTHWNVDTEHTKMMKGYLDFWNNLYTLYSSFNTRLLEKNIGHQGLVYRQACEKLDDYLEKNTHKKFVFVGFNALNTAESHIIQKILTNANGDIYWDIDTYFLNDPIHDAAYFIREHKRKWPFLKENPLQGISDYYSTEKKIQIIGVPKNVSQAKYLGGLIERIHQNHHSLKNTALVLADESLLNPVLNSIPKNIETVNVTMGYPLHKTPLASLFTQLFQLYLYKEQKGWFYKNVLPLLAHPYIKELFQREKDGASQITRAIKTKNWTYLTLSKLKSVFDDEKTLSLIFTNQQPTPAWFIDSSIQIILELKSRFQESENILALEYLSRFYALFNQISELVKTHPFIKDLKALYGLYTELLASETVDFQGNPLEGLQIMGMLESRNLDFETVILTSVNEGILPSGKSNNSFIPFDLKTGFGLPTYKEKDAVYTYHFYRLLQRAKNVYILYNTEPDVLEGGEKSRLITQLLTDTNKINQIHNIIAAPTILPEKKTLATIFKDEGLIALIEAHARRGFSPTSLSNYIRNPLDFYKKNLLGIDDLLEVEENVAANTFGTIVHDTLEELYTPLVGKTLSETNLKPLFGKIKDLVKVQFRKSYSEGDITHGKNLIAFNVIVRYIENFIKNEIQSTYKQDIKILALEQNLKIELDVPKVAIPVVLKGKLDRVDIVDDTIRILDYKTGKVQLKDVEIVDWAETTSDYEYSKAFQLLCYALMYHNSNTINEMTAGIISFKNLKAGTLKFALKDRRGAYAKKQHAITIESIEAFSAKLYKLIQEICNPNIPLEEKEV